MIKQWQSMSEYHHFIHESKVHFDSSEKSRMHNELWIPWQKLKSFNTDIAMDFLFPFFSNTGRPARNQPQILRSFLLFAMLVSLGKTSCSLTSWINSLKTDRVLAALIGCTTDSLPPLGSYYDFIDRLWHSNTNDIYGRNYLLPASWHSIKPDKPKGQHQKAPERSTKITEVLVNRLLAHKDIYFNNESFLQDFFYQIAVLPSLELGVIPNENLTISGDGTAVHTHANPHGHHLCDTSEMTIEEVRLAPRHFSDPDATWGYDSDLEKSYYGYTLFHLSCYNKKICADVPILLRFTSARRHDAVNFLVAFNELEKHMPNIKPKNICLDSAMDNYPTYYLLRDRGIAAFIDLNSRRGRPKSVPDNIKIDKNGTPICDAGLKMSPNGYDKSRGDLIWRCPFSKEHSTKCSKCCSDAKYGRVIKTKPDWDIRLYTEVTRGTNTYKEIYKERTATERINNRILNDYGLHKMKIHTKKHYSFFTMIIAVCLHLDAQYKLKTQAS